MSSILGSALTQARAKRLQAEVNREAERLAEERQRAWDEAVELRGRLLAQAARPLSEKLAACETFEELREELVAYWQEKGQ